MSKDYFNSIDDLPIWNWWKIAETSNLIYLHKGGDYSKKDYTLTTLWNKLQDEYLDEFGITDDFRKLLSLKKRWIKGKANFLISGDRFILNELDVIESDLNELEVDKEKVDKDNTLIMLEQKLNRGLDPKEISVKKYYKYINYFSKK